MNNQEHINNFFESKGPETKTDALMSILESFYDRLTSIPEQNEWAENQMSIAKLIHNLNPQKDN